MTQFQLDTQIPLESQFTPIDPIAAMDKGAVAAQNISKAQSMQSDQQDQQAIQNYQRSGGDLYSQEGISKAIADLKGKISPNNYMELVKYGENYEKHQIDIASKLASQPGEVLKKFNDQRELGTRLVVGALDTYNQTWQKTLTDKGLDPSQLSPDNPELVAAKKQAAPQYEAAKQAQIQMLQQQPGATNVMPKDMLQQFSQMDIPAAEDAYRKSQYAAELAAQAAKIRSEQASAAEAEAKATYYREGGAKSSSIKTIEEAQSIIDNPQSSPEMVKAAKALLDKTTKGTSGQSMLSDEDAAYMAADYRRFGSSVLARLGALDRGRVIHMAAQQAREEGKTGEADSLNRMSERANQQGLNAITRQESMIGAYEKTADKQLGLLVDLGKKIDRTDWPIINKALIEGRKTIEGNPDASNFLSTIITTQADLARVLSGATSAAGTSDAARREAAEMLSKSLSQEQIESLSDNIRKELAFKMDGYAEQKKQLLDSSKIGSPAGFPKVTPSQQSSRDDDATAIRQDELKKEQDELAKAKAAGNQNAIKTHTQNIAELQREMGNGNAQVPKGLPAQSKKIGTTPEGKPVWQSPDGKNWIE